MKKIILLLFALVNIGHAQIKLVLQKTSLQPYVITIDYQKTPKELIAKGKYDRVDPNLKALLDSIKERGLPYMDTVKRDVEVTIFQVKCSSGSLCGISFQKVVDRMKDQGYRPLTFLELLTLSAKYPYISAIALGPTSIWCDEDQVCVLAYVHTEESKRLISLERTDAYWSGDGFNFPAIKRK